MSISLITHVWKAALRDKLVLTLLALIGLSVSMSIFIASSALIEKDQFAAVFSAGSLRILGVLGLTVFTVFFIRRSVDAKDIEFILSCPVGRVEFVFSYAFALSCIACVIALANGIALYAISPHLFGLGHVIWTISVALEYIIMINMAFFFGLMLSSAAMAVLSVLGFYVLTRMMGQILGIIDAGFEASYLKGLQIILELISVITPRLDLLGQTGWLIYGTGDLANLVWVGAQVVVALCLVLCAALFDLLKRQF